MKHLSAAALVGILFFSVLACAQVPPSATLPPKDIPLLQDSNAPVEVKDLNQFVQTDKTISESVKWRQEERDVELKEGGFEWMPWAKAGPKALEFVLDREPGMKWDLNDPEVTRYYDFAVADIDQDAQPDILTYNWGDCGTLGCTFSIYFSNKSRKPQTYYGHKLRQFQKGVMLDDKAYFSY